MFNVLTQPDYRSLMSDDSHNKQHHTAQRPGLQHWQQLTGLQHWQRHSGTCTNILLAMAFKQRCVVWSQVDMLTTLHHTANFSYSYYYCTTLYSICLLYTSDAADE